jgi:NAD(P)-dependent dehydrogenase (short-subunit alcohol dehydrogenase family)
MVNPVGELSGRVVVITGAGGGLGRAYALAAAAKGAAVAVNDVDADAAQAVVDAIAAAGGAALAIPGSVADEHAVDAMFAACAERLGPVDGLVNNAAVAHHGPAWDDEPARVRRLVEVNVLGSLFCGVAALRQMRRSGRGGAIVNVTSGAHLGMAGVAAYGAAKGAVVSMTLTWALEAAALGVRVNAISPLARTPMSEAGGVDASALPAPESIAPAVVFLLSARSAPLTGRVVRFDGTTLSLIGPAERVDLASRERWALADFARHAS